MSHRNGNGRAPHFHDPFLDEEGDEPLPNLDDDDGLTEAEFYRQLSERQPHHPAPPPTPPAPQRSLPAPAPAPNNGEVNPDLFGGGFVMMPTLVLRVVNDLEMAALLSFLLDHERFCRTIIPEEQWRGWFYCSDEKVREFVPSMTAWRCKMLFRNMAARKWILMRRGYHLADQGVSVPAGRWRSRWLKINRDKLAEAIARVTQNDEPTDA